jgi:hypothetical protein
VEKMLRDALAELDQIDLDDPDCMPSLYKACKKLEKVQNKTQAVAEVFRFIERNPQKELGAPGPLVGFVQNVPGYEKELIRSVERSPTPEELPWLVFDEDGRLAVGYGVLRPADRQSRVERDYLSYNQMVEDIRIAARFCLTDAVDCLPISFSGCRASCRRRH